LPPKAASKPLSSVAFEKFMLSPPNRIFSIIPLFPEKRKIKKSADFSADFPV
jgi:hypothetical protein